MVFRITVHLTVYKKQPNEVESIVVKQSFESLIFGTRANALACYDNLAKTLDCIITYVKRLYRDELL